MGSCYDLLHKPYPLYQRHVDMYRHRVIMGTYKGNEFDPEIDQRKSLGSMSSKNRQGLEDATELNEEIPIDDPNYVVRHKEMFWESNSETRGIYFNEDMVDFGFSVSGTKSEVKEVTLINELNYDVTVYWAIPNVPNVNAQM